MVQRAEKKLYLDTMVHRGDGISLAGGDGAAAAAEDPSAAPAADAGSGLSGAELLATLRFGADALFRTDEGAEPSDEELDALCDRSEGGEARRAALLGGRLDADASKSAAEFVGSGQPLSTFILHGEDFGASRRAAAKAAAEDPLASIAHKFLARSGRSRTTTTVMVDGFAVKRANMYSLEEGEPSVFEREAAAGGGAHGGFGSGGGDDATLAAPPGAGAPSAGGALDGGADGGGGGGKRHVDRAGRDYPHADLCQVCWSDGRLFCCDQCPAAYHAACVGETERALERANPWACPHHACATCGRKAAAAGGLLFRCECCASAFCEVRAACVVAPLPFSFGLALVVFSDPQHV